MPLEAYGCTHVGRVRVENQDSHRMDIDAGVFLVADGIGGHVGGDVASRIASDAALKAFKKDPARDPRSAVRVAFAAAKLAVMREVEDQPWLEPMGTTLVSLLVRDRIATIGNVGDSRAYLYRARRLTQLTRDQALGHKLMNAISRAAHGTPEVGWFSPEPGDLAILCSDGLSSMVENDAIESALREAADIHGTAPPLDWICADLLAIALAAGGHDNVTVLAVRFV